MAGVLAGYRVLEIAGEMAVPIAGMLLADNGAEVIKVEPPGGDPWRVLPGARVWNRGKRSLTLNLEPPEGRAALERLLPGVDVVLTGLAPAELRARRLDAATLAASFPRLVVCNVTGYGIEGRDSDRPAYDALVAARMGLNYQQGGDQPPPRYLGWPMPSYSTGILVTTGIATALYLREREGRGQGIDISLKDGALAMLTMHYAVAERVLPVASGPAHKKRLLVENFLCADGEWLHLHTGAAGAFDRLMDALELPAHARRAFADEEDWARMIAEVEARFRARPREHWLARLEEFDIPSLPVLRHGEALLDPQTKAMGYAITVPDPELGDLLEVAPPIRFEKTPGAVRASAPRVGEHTEALLEQAGFTAAEREALRARGII